MNTFKRLITALFILHSIMANSQEYWATYLPDVSTWPDYYNENLYYMDTTTSPLVCKIDHSLTDPSRTFDGIDDLYLDNIYTEANSNRVRSNVMILFKCGTEDTISTGYTSLQFQGVENVFVGSYGTGAAPKIRTHIHSGHNLSHLTGNHITDGCDRIWFDNIEFGSDGAAYETSAAAGRLYRYEWSWYLGFTIENTTGKMFEKIIFSRINFNRVSEPINSSGWGHASRVGGVDTCVMVYCEDHESLREGYNGVGHNGRIYDNDPIGDCNWEWFYDPDGHSEDGAGGDSFTVSPGNYAFMTLKGGFPDPPRWIFKNNNITKHHTGLKHVFLITHTHLASIYSDTVSTLGSCLILDGNTITPGKDTVAVNQNGRSNFFGGYTADSIYLINNYFWDGGNIDYTSCWPGKIGIVAAKSEIIPVVLS